MERFKGFLKDNWLLIFGILYLIMPADILPDFIPLLGKADDSAVLLLDLIKRYVESKPAK
ncbi:DUF1232 domain-containing protein [bacterium]|nr:DUF1232 domain-containing protein [bacterium]